jgi:hypothetical protein
MEKFMLTVWSGAKVKEYDQEIVPIIMSMKSREVIGL